MINVLFIGNYLSKQTGTMSISETISKNLDGKKFNSFLCSHIRNKFFRLLDFIIKTSFYNYDIIQIDVFSGPAFNISMITSLIAKMRGKKIILTLRGGNLPNYYLINKKKINKVFSTANHIQTPSTYIMNFFKHHNITYMPNPIDISKFPFKLERSNANKILWVRAFTEIYKPQLAVNVLKKIKVNYPNATLTMVGPDKGNLKKIKKKIKKLNLISSIKIEGPVENAKLFSYYHSHDVFINTTSLESFGNAVAEAASSGIPIISNRVGELPFIWTHKKNILFSEPNSNSFSENLNLLFKSKELRNKISINAQKRLEDFKIETIIKKWESKLLKLYKN